MTNLAKIADIVFLLIDASIGFEMQTFEFLTIMQAHNFPKCIGVVTHLDYYKENKQKRKIKKMLAKRFEKEVTKKTKLFFMQGLKNDKYFYRDVHNLARFVSVIVPREVEFKKNNAHIIVDRFESSSQQTSAK